MEESKNSSSSTLVERERQKLITHRFTIDRVLSYFDKTKLGFLQHEFRKNAHLKETDGYTLIDFVRVVLRAIPHKPEDLADLIYGVYALYREIDINGDEHLSWDEFTSFILESANVQSLETSTQVFEGNQSLQQAEQIMLSEETAPKYLHHHNLLIRAIAQKVPVFGESKVFVDTLSRNSAVVKALVYKKIDAIILMESNTRRLKVVQACSNNVIPGITSEDTSHRTKVLQTIELHLPNEAYILGAALNEEDGMLAVTSTEGLMYFYKYSTQIQRFRVFKIICCCNIDGCQHNIWYLPMYGSYFTAGAKNILREWKISPKKRKFDANSICTKCTNNYFPKRGSKILSEHTYETSTNFVERPFNATQLSDATFSYLQPLAEFNMHKDMIQDIIQMNYPYRAFLTGCHDGKIHIIQEELNRIVGVLDTGHQTGIRQLDYTPFHGGALISVGYEQFFNVWEMEGSGSFGKRKHELAKRLTMINYPVVGAKFLGNSFFVAAVDQANTVKIYNYKTSEVIQSLQQSFLKQQNVTGLMVFSEGKFVLLGKKMVYYDTLGEGNINAVNSHIYTKKEIEIRRLILNERGKSEMEQASVYHQMSSILPAIDALFIEYYQTLLVLSKSALRVYNTSNGRLIKILQDIPAENTDLTCMTLDRGHRKVYIGDSNGRIRIFNVNSCAFIASFEPSEALREQINDQGVQTTKELVGLKFFNAPQERNEKFEKIKLDHGVTQGKDYQKPNFMLITGQGSNRVSAWDVNDSENCEMMRTASAASLTTEDIQSLTSSEHHCLIATGGVLGTISVWDFELFKLVHVFHGCSGGVTVLEFADKFPLLVGCSQQGVICVYAIRGAHLSIQGRCLARFVNLNQEMDGQFLNMPITCGFLKIRENKSEGIDDSKLGGKSVGNVMFFKTELDEAGQKAQKFKTEYSNLINEYKLTFYDDGLPKNLATAIKDNMMSKIEELQVQVKNASHAKLFQRCFPPRNSDKPFIMELIFGDSEGNIKCLDLSAFVRQPRNQTLSMAQMAEQDSSAVPYVGQIKAYPETKVGFTSNRRLLNKGGGLGAESEQKQSVQKFPTILDASKCVLIKVIQKAHKSRINSLRPINVKPFGFISTSMDKFVKMWTETGEVCGEICLSKEITRLTNWKFNYDWGEHAAVRAKTVHDIQVEMEKQQEKSSMQTSNNQSVAEGIKSFKQSPKAIRKFHEKLHDISVASDEQYFGIKHRVFQDQFDRLSAVKHLVQEQNLTYKESKQEYQKMFYGDKEKNNDLKYPVVEDIDEAEDVKRIGVDDPNHVDNVLPMHVWKKLIDVEEERRLIKNLTTDYEQFIKTGSVEEIQRTCLIQQSSDPKDQKLVKAIKERVQKQRGLNLEQKYMHRLSLRMGINLQQAQLGKSVASDYRTDRGTSQMQFTFQTYESTQSRDKPTTTEHHETIKIENQGEQTASKNNRRSSSVGRLPLAAVSTANSDPDPENKLQGVPFTLKQYTEQSTRKIGGQKNTINVLKESSEQVMKQVQMQKNKSDATILNLKNSIQFHKSPDLERLVHSRSVPKLMRDPEGPNRNEKNKKVGFLGKITEAQKQKEEAEFKQMLDVLTYRQQSLQNIIDAKAELEHERQNLQSYDPDFFKQLSERLSVKHLDEQQKLLNQSSNLNQSVVSLRSQQHEQSIQEMLRQQNKSKFRRNPVVGISNSRNTNSRFLNRLDRFVDISDRRIKHTEPVRTPAVDEEDLTPRALRCYRNAQSQKQLPRYEGDFMLKPGETARRINQAFSQLNAKNYADLAKASVSGTLHENGNQIVRQMVEWRSIQKNKEHADPFYRFTSDNGQASTKRETVMKPYEMDALTARLKADADHFDLSRKIGEQLGAQIVRSSFIAKIALSNKGQQWKDPELANRAMMMENAPFVIAEKV